MAVSTGDLITISKFRKRHFMGVLNYGNLGQCQLHTEINNR